jgi:hypothetical protein
MSSPDFKEKLEGLLKRGARFWVEDKRLRYEAETGVLSVDDLLWLKTYRNEVALFCLKQELQRVKSCYQLCREGERMPHYRTLSAECLAEGKRAFKRMELQMRNLENDIIRLTCSNSFYSP